MTARFDDGCAQLLLTIKRGPATGRTTIFCTCGWKHTYKSRRKAEKRTAEHNALNNPPAAAKPPENTA